MSENILVVEYEPRYTDRVRQALAGQPFTTTFARDGEEAIRALEFSPRLIVLSSVVPKISTTELIRTIRGRKPLQETPILLTVSGYNGKSPKADAQRVGASDILPKPYSETEFLGKVQQMLGVRASAPAFDPDMTVRDEMPVTQQLTSSEIFGDLVDDDSKPAKKTMASKPNNDIDKMLADTLSGVRPARKAEPTVAVPMPPQQPPAPPAAAPAPPPQPAAAKPRTQSGSTSLDKMLSDTLSGLEKTARKQSGSIPRPNVPSTPPPAPAPPPAAPPQQPNPKFNTERLSTSAYVPDRVPVSQPVVPQPPAPTPEVAPFPEDEPSDGTKFGQYVLVEKIATGGMAEVWKARMRGVEGFQKIVAIKKILPHLSDNQDFIEMFVDEAKLAAQLNHNNIIHIYDLGKIQSSYYIAMEYIDGYDLKTILRRGEERDHPMSVELALFIASKIASALDYAHRKKDFEDREMGLVHRDVSPQNVLISQEGDIKLCDFGIAKAASKASHTQAGALKGKLQYMSPEQAWGRSIDRRSDIFALATVLFEMLTNRKLFTGDNELSILEQVREARVTAPSQFNDEVTPEIDRIVLKALQKDPANRYQTAGEMARDLDAILYSFRPTPTSADLAIYMHRMSSAEPVMMPQPAVETPAPLPTPAAAPMPVAVAAAAAAPIAAAPVAAAPSADFAPLGGYEEPKKKSPAVLAGIAAAVLIVIAGAVMMMRKPAAPQTASATTTSATTSQTTTAAATTATLAPATTAAATPAQPAIDPSAVDQEVQKRLAAERARLEAQTRAQQQAAAVPAAVPARNVPAPAPAQQQPAVATPPPAPVQQAQQPETRPAPAPVQQPVERAPEPAPQQAESRTREGDTVPAGTDGLTAPRLVRRGPISYPPIARMQRIQGTVVTNVFVSEDGAVLDVRILRGINGPSGLNEAAIAAMRRSSFAPATKDGVRVKSWVTVPVEFKL